MSIHRALAVLSLAASLASCSTPVERRRSTEQTMKELRPEAAGLIGSLGEEEDADGIPLLRHEGKLINRHLLGGDEEAAVVRASTWALDAWGNPIVLLQDLEHPADWCLISAGPDGVWTADGELAAASYRGDREELCARSPLYARGEPTESLRVVGDDIVLQADGNFARRYPHRIPDAEAVSRWFLTALQGQPSIHFELGAELRREIEALSPEDRGRIATWVEQRAAGAFLSEDTWGHEGRRKEGLRPRLYLCHERPPVGGSIWIEPGRAGWALDASPSELLDRAQAAAVGSPAR